MAMKIKFLNNKKVQFYRKGAYVDVACAHFSQTCTWACILCPEPISEGGLTYITFGCSSIGPQFAIPDADFTDER
jgi:hypothetical protein